MHVYCYELTGENLDTVHARVLVTDDGMIAIESGFGGWTYWWSGGPTAWGHPDFRKLLLRINSHYVTGALSRGCRHYDGDATERAIKRYICEQRRTQSLNAAKARDEWDRLHFWGAVGDEQSFALWCEHTELLDEPWREGVYTVAPQLARCIELFWPLLQAGIRSELAAEAA